MVMHDDSTVVVTLLVRKDRMDEEDKNDGDDSSGVSPKDVCVDSGCWVPFGVLEDGVLVDRGRAPRASCREIFDIDPHAMALSLVTIS
ncbi:hypothetical protein PIIN_10409 [Serendipita indica DSM 11827]|uniref:Uncharacterized protein n=1 Tax=Serendipita indica (strain DSM 11827) TaxID=1109443 RepID=G4TYM3_SERID|nr:hypothetical protein PIIN_10409 [Serendipita indica DSM 11827]